MSGASAIQTIVAWNWSATSLGSSAAAITSPREQSISASSVSVTDWPARARGEIAVRRYDACDRRFAPGRQHAHFVAGAHFAGSDASGEAAERAVGAVHPLHRHAERRCRRIVGNLNARQMCEQRRTIVPGHVHAGGDDIVAVNARDRDSVQRPSAPRAARMRDTPQRSPRIPARSIRRDPFSSPPAPRGGCP